MSLNKHFLLSLIFCLGFCLTDVQAQLVNYEETWQEFLKNPKTSNISKLAKPEKSQPANYIKYSLMYANSYFCADNIPSADKMLREVASMGDDIQAKVPGFKERYEDLKIKIKAYKKLTPIWLSFLENKSVTISTLETVPEAKKVCEKGTLCKYFYMTSYAYYCKGDLEKSRGHFKNRVLKLAATSFEPKNIEGLNEEIEMMKILWAGIDALNPAWDKFVQSDESPGFDTELPLIACYPIPTIKAYLLQAAVDPCVYGSEMLEKIKALDNPHDLPADVAAKLEWLENEVNGSNKALAELNAAWEKFVPKNKLPKGTKYGHEFVCDREAEVKAYLMDGLLNPCVDGTKALESIAKVRKEHKPELGNITVTKLKQLKNLTENEAENVAKLNETWADFEPDEKLDGSLDVEFEYCDKVAQTKAYIMDGILNVCEKGQQRLDDIDNLKAEYAPELDGKTTAKVDRLKELVKQINDDTKEINEAWELLMAGEVPDIDYKYEFMCNRELDVRAHIMDGLSTPCEYGATSLKKAKAVIEKYNPELGADTKAKLKELENVVGKEAAALAKLNAAWKDFVPDNKLSGKVDFVFEYCDKLAQAKAYLIDGTMNFCAKGEQRLEDMATLLENHEVNMDATTREKYNILQKMLNDSQQDFKDLETAWALHLENDVEPISNEGFPAKDEVIRDQIRLVDFYCDKIAQTKSWVIKGQLDPCEKGDAYLAKIKGLKKKHNLEYDEALKCQVDRLTAKVYQCRYWALVLKAWQITYDECQRFGPASSKVMYDVLNEGEMPCETRVAFEQLGKIGIKYTITTVLCQRINLAQMGDPEYYKKIASWVDTEVLQKYCNTTNWRCKKDFFIYLEGHTDGHRFSGATYDKSLDIPEGTPFTHFVGKPKGAGADTLSKTTRNITSKLNSNMELGIARAWTVKQQLDFMGVPTTIGAYEHPSDEKDGDYRRIEIELNITNLFLDFFEKTLKELITESGIGDRPGVDCPE